MRKTARTALALTLAALVMGTAGCYGSYSATKKLHRWNGDATDNKFANSAIHLGLIIIPVYPLLLVGDLLVFNTVEVLTGENPMK